VVERRQAATIGARGGIPHSGQSSLGAVAGYTRINRRTPGTRFRRLGKRITHTWWMDVCAGRTPARRPMAADKNSWFKRLKVVRIPIVVIKQFRPPRTRADRIITKVRLFAHSIPEKSSSISDPVRFSSRAGWTTARMSQGRLYAARCSLTFSSLVANSRGRADFPHDFTLSKLTHSSAASYTSRIPTADHAETPCAFAVVGGTASDRNRPYTKILAFRGIPATPRKEAKTATLLHIEGPHKGARRRPLLLSRRETPRRCAPDRSYRRSMLFIVNNSPSSLPLKAQGTSPHDPRPLLSNRRKTSRWPPLLSDKAEMEVSGPRRICSRRC